MSKLFTAMIEFDPETNMYVGVVPGIPGAHSQAETVEQLTLYMKEVLELCLEDFEGDVERLPQFVGTQQIELA